MGKLFGNVNPINFGIEIDPDDLEILKQRVYGEYGYPLVKVEMTDSQLYTAIHSGIEWINTWSPKAIELETYVNPNQSDYEFYDLDRRINDVLDVYCSINAHIMSGAPAEILFPEIGMIRGSHDATTISDYAVKMAQHQVAKTVFGCKPDAQVIGPKTLRVLPRPLMEAPMMFKVVTNHDPDLGSLDEYETNWLIRWVTTKAGKILGNVRSKYSGVALPIGDLSNDGGTLKTDSKEAEDKLIEEIKTRHKFAESYVMVG